MAREYIPIWVYFIDINALLEFIANCIASMFSYHETKKNILCFISAISYSEII